MSKVSLGGLWPLKPTAEGEDGTTVPGNTRLFEAYGAAGNFQALIMLGVASLYGEGAHPDADLAAVMLTKAELSSKGVPFSWLLFRCAPAGAGAAPSC